MDDESLARRTFAISLLDELATEGELSFGELLYTVGPSRATLSTTLIELGDDGLVHKRRLGRHTYYSITGRGAQALTEAPPGTMLLDDRITNLVGRRLTVVGEWDPQLFKQDMWIRRLRGKVVGFINRIQSQGPKGLINGKRKQR